MDAAKSRADDAEQAYILGTEDAELARLRFQHQAWVAQAYALWQRAGLRAGQVVLDLGCGPGFTSCELAHVVGPAGRVVARDRSAGFLAFLSDECERLGWTHVEPSLGEVEDLDLPAASLDAAYARWLLCWLADAGAVVEGVAGALRPGGALLLQEYVDWGAMKLLPRNAAFDRAVEACLESWELGGATIDVGEQVPAMADRCGLAVECFRPVARAGRRGSLEWGWIRGFFGNYLPKLVASGLLDGDEVAAALDALDGLGSTGSGYCYTPTMVDVILRKPE